MDDDVISVRAGAAMTGLIDLDLNAVLLMEYTGASAPDGKPEVRKATEDCLRTAVAGAAETVQQSVSSQVDVAEHDIMTVRKRGYVQLVMEAQASDVNAATLLASAGDGKVKPITLDGTSDEEDLIKVVAITEEKTLHVDGEDIATFVRLLI